MTEAGDEHKGEVSDADRYRPNLSIDTGLDFEDQMRQSVFAEIEQYSITPTTLKARKFFPGNGQLGMANEETCKVRSEIDSLTGKEELTAKITELEAYSRELVQYNEFIGQNPDLLLTYNDRYENGNSGVIRFGINTATMTSGQGKHLADIYTCIEKRVTQDKPNGKAPKKEPKAVQDFKKLHPLEVSLIREAIDHLNGENIKTVLVDIFARDDHGTIKLKNDEKPETHTIVLHKNAEQVVIIDPSNPSFSKHIPANTIRLFREGEESVGIVVPLKQKIYTPSGDVGPRANQYRDCIDISVKIAFGLNKLQRDIDINEFKSLSAIMEVTNQQKLFSDLFFSEEKTIARIRQASDDTIRASANNLMVKMKKQFASIDEYFQPNTDLVSKVLEDGIKAFSNDDYSEQYELGIERIHTICRKNMITFINEMQADMNLLGETIQLAAEEV